MIDDVAFDQWNEIKKKIHNRSRVEYFRERQIWWCSIGQNIGYEVYGKGDLFCRPVIVFKKLTSDTFIGIPITSRTKFGTWFVTFKHRQKDVCAMLHQIRTFDKKRLVDRFGEIDDQDFGRIIEGFCTLYCPKNIHPAKRRESMGKSQK